MINKTIKKREYDPPEYDDSALKEWLEKSGKTVQEYLNREKKKKE